MLYHNRMRSPRSGAVVALLAVFVSRADAGLVSARVYRVAGMTGNGFGMAVGGLGSVPFQHPESGTALVVGAPLAGTDPDAAGSVYVFRDPYSSVPDQTIESEAAEAGGHFGSSLAAFGANLDGLLVGAPGETVSGVARAGIVHVIRPNAERAVIANPAPSVASGFGSAVASAGRYVLIGAPASEDPTARGRAYLVDSDTATPTLLAHSGSVGSFFGIAVTAGVGDSGNVVAFVGAPFEGGAGHEVGMVYAYDATPQSPTFGTLLRTFPNPAAGSPGGGVQDAFGHALAADKGLLLVGAPLADVGEVDAAGKVYVFDGDPSSPTFGNLLRTIPNPNPSAGASFGGAVLVVPAVRALPDTIAVGAPFDDTIATDGGAVYLFDGDRQSDTFGKQVAHSPLLNPAATNYARMGFALALLGTGPEGADGIRDGGDVAAGAPGNARLSAEGLVVVLANCGNNIDAGEDCDDGNEKSSDGCSDVCKLEPLHCGGASTALVAPVDEPIAKRCPCGGAEQICSDGIDCTIDDCPEPGELCRSRPDSTRCPVADDACTDTVCDPTLGCVQKPRDCDDHNPCSQDSCKPKTGCVHQTAGCPCTDSDDCDPCRGEICAKCKGCLDWYPDRDCCKLPKSCRPEFQVVLGATTCDDLNACTTSDVCVAVGACSGTLVTDPGTVRALCPTPAPCTIAICTPTGCGTVPDPACKPPLCRDGCIDDDPCTKDDCLATGCSHPPVAGVDAVACVFERSVADCPADKPVTVRATIDRAREFVQQARATRRHARQRRLMEKARRKLVNARRQLAAERRIAPSCRAALGDHLHDLRRAVRAWLDAA